MFNYSRQRCEDGLLMSVDFCSRVRQMNIVLYNLDRVEIRLSGIKENYCLDLEFLIR